MKTIKLFYDSKKDPSIPNKKDSIILFLSRFNADKENVELLLPNKETPIFCQCKTEQSYIR